MTTAVGPRRPTAPSWRGDRRLLAGAAALVAGIVVAAVLVLGGGDDGGGQRGPDARTTATQPGGAGAARVDITLPGLLNRPNALTIAGGYAWAMSNRTGDIVLVDVDSGKVAGRRLNVGKGGSSLAAGFDAVWVTKETTSSLLRINATTRRPSSRGSIRLTTPGRNVAVATGAGAVWVAVRNRSPTYRGPETVVRVEPGSGAQRAISVPGGVQDLAVGEGAVWVTNRFASTVTRIRASDGAQKTVRVGRDPKGVAVGEGAVWVAASGDDEITRINPRSLQTRSIALDEIPERVTVGGGSVWATAREAGRLIRIDAKTRKVIERIDTGSRPFALDVTRGRAVWLSLLGSNGVQRVRFQRPA